MARFLTMLFLVRRLIYGDIYSVPTQSKKERKVVTPLGAHAASGHVKRRNFDEAKPLKQDQGMTTSEEDQ